MQRFLLAAIVGGLGLAQTASAQSQQPGAGSYALKAENHPNDLLTLPPAPRGKSTIIGGEIRNVDPVRDEFSLKIFGQGSMKILFDERTQLYLDGQKVPLRTLRVEDHASVQTVLDGAKVFALSIHILSKAPEGEYQGNVLNYNPGTGELAIHSALFPQPVKLTVPAGIPIVRVGQSAFTAAGSGSSDLVKGALVSIQFEPGKRGSGVASRIEILAAPGSAFSFAGTISSLDLHSGLLVLVDPTDKNSYQIFFDSVRVPAGQDLRPGENVAVTANYDGTRYVASEIRTY